MPDRKKILGIFIAIALSVTAIGTTYLAGYRSGKSETKVVEIKGIADISPGSDVNADFGIFWQAWSELKENYLRSGEVKDQEMIYAAIKGLAENLGDPYTTFFSPEEASKFNEDISGEFGGIGAELEALNGQIIVVAPMKGTPAERAGLKPRDIIIKANDTDLLGKDTTDAVKVIRGEPGTKVKLTILREGQSGTLEIDITREVIRIPAVEWEMRDSDILYLKLHNFNENAYSAFNRAILEVANKEKPKAMILDLRSNPGGYLEVSVDIAGWFIEDGKVIVREKYASGEDTEFKARGNNALGKMPLVVLVNGGSASAAEILAGALKDHKNVKIIGEKTFGKGTVQTLEELSDGSLLKITVANWLTPNGTVIDKQGIKPDIEVTITKEDVEKGKDTQLEKAIEAAREIKIK